MGGVFKIQSRVLLLESFVYVPPTIIINCRSGVVREEFTGKAPVDPRLSRPKLPEIQPPALNNALIPAPNGTIPEPMLSISNGDDHSLVRSASLAAREELGGAMPIHLRQQQLIPSPQIHDLTTPEASATTLTAEPVAVDFGPALIVIGATYPRESSTTSDSKHAPSAQPAVRRPETSPFSSNFGQHSPLEAKGPAALDKHAAATTSGAVTSDVASGSREMSTSSIRQISSSSSDIQLLHNVRAAPVGVPLDCNIPLADRSDPCWELGIFFASQNGRPRFAAICTQDSAWHKIMRAISADSDARDVDRFTAMFPKELRFRIERKSYGLLTWMELHARYKTGDFRLTPHLRRALEDAHGLLIAYAA